MSAFVATPPRNSFSASAWSSACASGTPASRKRQAYLGASKVAAMYRRLLLGRPLVVERACPGPALGQLHHLFVSRSGAELRPRVHQVSPLVEHVAAAIERHGLDRFEPFLRAQGASALDRIDALLACR
jgi:hypothetical protein